MWSVMNFWGWEKDCFRREIDCIYFGSVKERPAMDLAASPYS